MPKQAIAKRVFHSNAFSLLATGSTAVLDALTGKSIIVTKAWLEIVSNTGINSTNPVLSLGNNSASFNNLMPSTTPPVGAGLNNACDVFELPIGSINPATYTVGRRWPRLSLNSTGISVNVTTAASGGTVSAMQGRIFIEGWLL